MDIQEFKNSLNRLDELHQKQGYESALRLLQELLPHSPYSVELLIKYAKVIQLLDKEDLDSFPSLDKALESLKQAHLISPQTIEPCIELGYFEYAVNDCPSEAIQYFQIATENAESGLKSALIGQIKCYLDIGNIAQARNTLTRAKVFFPNDSEIEIIEFELEE